MRLSELFASLPLPTSGGALPSFSTIALQGGPHRLGKDIHGAPALLVSVALGSGSRPAPVELEHVTLQHDVACQVFQPGGAEQATFTLMRCREFDRVLGDFFLGVVEGVLPLLGPTPSGREVASVVEALGELFRALQMPAGKTVQGLWAELLLLAEARDPATLADAWHAVPQEPYDFSLGAQRIEVKSGVGPERRHYFKLEQLRPAEGTKVLIASAFVERSGGGCSVADLLNRVKARLGERPERLLRLDRIVAGSLGEDWRKGLDERFDLERGRSSLSFYWAENVPSIPSCPPPGVTEVRFRSDLTGVPPASVADLRNQGALFADGVPPTFGSGE